MKKFKIYSHEQLVGTSDLEFSDPGMSIYSGYLFVTSDYDNIRSIFKIFSLALDLTGDEQAIQLERYYRARDDLKLTVKSQDCNTLVSNWIHIVDIADSLVELQVEISLSEPLDK